MVSGWQSGQLVDRVWSVLVSKWSVVARWWFVCGQWWSVSSGCMESGGQWWTDPNLAKVYTIRVHTFLFVLKLQYTLSLSLETMSIL